MHLTLGKLENQKKDTDEQTNELCLWVKESLLELKIAAKNKGETYYKVVRQQFLSIFIDVMTQFYTH